MPAPASPLTCTRPARPGCGWCGHPSCGPPIRACLRAALDNDAGATLLNRYRELGDPDDLGTAIELFNDAVALSPPGATSWARSQGNLTWAIREAYRRTGNPDTLDAAIELAREAVGGADPTPDPALARPPGRGMVIGSTAKR